jgi:hypothetical protein
MDISYIAAKTVGIRVHVSAGERRILPEEGNEDGVEIILNVGELCGKVLSTHFPYH